MQNFWKNKRVLVTGGNGFIGSHVVRLLRKKNALIFIPTGDLRNKSVALKSCKNIDIVLHLASRVAGIQYNVDHPVEMFEDNVEITKNILHAAYKNNVDRVLLVSSACVYPRHAKTPTPESEGFKNDPEPTNLGYGWSKRVMEVMGKLYYQEFGLKVAIARPYNAYGPGDNFNPKISHVIPSLIKRVFDNENPLMVWGSGSQTRSFIYVEDLALGLLKLIEQYPIPHPVNIGSTEEVSIRSLARIIVNLTNKKTQIIFDNTKPEGQPRRLPDIKLAKKMIGFKAETSLKIGLKKTIEWYQKQLLLSSPVTKSRALKK